MHWIPKVKLMVADKTILKYVEATGCRIFVRLLAMIVFAKDLLEHGKENITNF